MVKELEARSTWERPLYLAMRSGVGMASRSSPTKLLSDPKVPINAESNQISGMLTQSYPPEP